MENKPFEDMFPIENGDSPARHMTSHLPMVRFHPFALPPRFDKALDKHLGELGSASNCAKVKGDRGLEGFVFKVHTPWNEHFRTWK